MTMMPHSSSLPVPFRPPSWLSGVSARVRRSPSLLAGLIMLTLLLIATVVGPMLSGFDPNEVSLDDAMMPPSAAHWFGTDNLGRDILVRVMEASRTDLEIAAVCVALPFLIGSMIGAVSAYIGGIFDAVVMRIIDIVWAFPFYVLVIAIVGSLGPSVGNMYLAFTLVVWISFARIVRGEVLLARELEYVQAARMLGFSHARIVFRHLIPNVITPAIVFAMSDVILTILAVTSLGFLGLGIQPPQAEWGVMVAEGRNFIFDAPWITIFPGLAIIYVGITFALISDGIDDFLSPKS
ncbi:ABC transporter permease [Microvirga sp. M2]|uniref:ABC transporter permease n=1 Tax=Microvirga sp. M2 TaxID=3073270 RepID=UPI0039C2CFDC